MPREHSTKDIEKAIRKLGRPPRPQNFVRNVNDSIEKTAKSLVGLALGFPTVTYAAGTKIVKDCIDLNLDASTALNAATTKGAAASRVHNSHYVSAFLEERDSLGLVGRKSFDQFVSPYRVSADVQLPVQPLTVLLDSGRFRTVSVVGWTNVPFDDFKWRLYFSILEDAVFSLEDFEDARGVFYAFPRSKKTDPKSRSALVAERGDFKLFSSSDLKEIMDNYVKALELAKEILRAKPVVDPEPPRLPRPDLPLFDFL